MNFRYLAAHNSFLLNILLPFDAILSNMDCIKNTRAVGRSGDAFFAMKMHVYSICIMSSHTKVLPSLCTAASVTRRLDYSFNFWPFTAMNICPTAHKNFTKDIIFRQRGEIWPNLVTQLILSNRELIWPFLFCCFCPKDFHVLDRPFGCGKYFKCSAIVNCDQTFGN